MLDSPTADSAERGTIFTQQQPCARPLRGRPGYAHDGGQSPALTARQQLKQSLNDIAHVLRMCQRARFVHISRPAYTGNNAPRMIG